MSIFKWIKKEKKPSNEEVIMEQSPKECGLKVKQTENGYFGVYQMQTNDEIVVTGSKIKAEEAKRNLDELINWDTEKDVYFSILQGDEGYDLFLKFQEIIDFFGLDDEEGKTEKHHYEKHEESGILYKVTNEQGNKKQVRGELITEGLALHKENEKEWTIDHIPSANMLSALESYEQAKTCAIAISDIVRWGDKNIIELFIEVPDFKEYLKEVKKAVVEGKELPERPQRLKYKIEFFQFKNEKMDFKRFCKAIDKLMDLHGLEVIKREVLEMIYKLRGQGRNLGKIKQTKENLHMVFEGPAGTGKTEVARIMSEIFASLGMLEKGNLVEADRSSLVAEHIGKTAPKVKRVVQKALGGTLFIDEAYSLAGDDQDFGPEAIATLIKEMEDHRGEFIVILAGYPADMNKLLESNEGFRSRINTFFHFYDYTPEQISDIVQTTLINKGYVFSEEVKNEIKRAVKGISKQGKIDGNARKARDIAQEIEEELNIRLGKDKDYEIFDTRMITIEDVKRATDENTKVDKREELEEIKKEALIKLNNLIGLKELKEKANSILNTIMIDNMRYQNGLVSNKTRMHMVYYGPPGTGKTTVARIMGEFLKGAGMLSSGHFIEASRNDLVAGYVGQTAAKVKNVIAKAMGGVLFIDEAYSLASGDAFGKEAVDTLIKEMEDRGDNLVVILAGYREDMEKLMGLNEGLRSRVPFHFDFPSYNAKELYQMMEFTLKKDYSLRLDDFAKDRMKTYIEREASENGGFVKGDGRWIRNVAEEIKVNQSNRLAKESSEGQEITIDKLQEIKISDIPQKNA